MVIAKSIDCYSPLTASEARALKAQGYGAVMRYIGTSDKCMTLQEVQAIKDAGLSIISLFETNPTQASYFTPEQGRIDMDLATSAARALGQDEGTMICLTVDYDAAVGDLGAIQAYMNEARSITGYKPGMYGGYLVVENIIADAYIQTAAWSNGLISAKAQVYQHTFNQSVAGLTVDISDIYHNPGWWPTPKGDIRLTTLQNTMLLGSSGVNVEELQRLLNANGASLTVDGHFGPITEKAVVSYQEKHNLKPDGIVGTITWDALNAPTSPPTPVSDTPVTEHHAATVEVTHSDGSKETITDVAELNETVQ